MSTDSSLRLYLNSLDSQYREICKIRAWESEYPSDMEEGEFCESIYYSMGGVEEVHSDLRKGLFLAAIAEASRLGHAPVAMLRIDAMDTRYIDLLNVAHERPRSHFNFSGRENRFEAAEREYAEARESLEGLLTAVEAELCSGNPGEPFKPIGPVKATADPRKPLEAMLVAIESEPNNDSPDETFKPTEVLEPSSIEVEQAPNNDSSDETFKPTEEPKLLEPSSIEVEQAPNNDSPDETCKPTEEPKLLEPSSIEVEQAPNNDSPDETFKPTGKRSSSSDPKFEDFDKTVSVGGKQYSCIECVEGYELFKLIFAAGGAVVSKRKIVEELGKKKIDMDSKHEPARTIKKLPEPLQAYLEAIGGATGGLKFVYPQKKNAD